MIDDTAKRILGELTKLRKAQERVADALEAANAADPLAMIQGALGGEQPPPGYEAVPGEPWAARPAPGTPDVPPDQAWRLR